MGHPLLVGDPGAVAGDPSSAHPRSRRALRSQARQVGRARRAQTLELTPWERDEGTPASSSLGLRAGCVTQAEQWVLLRCSNCRDGQARGAARRGTQSAERPEVQQVGQSVILSADHDPAVPVAVGDH